MIVHAAEPGESRAQLLRVEDMAGGQASPDHYSSLQQINRGNVKQLKVAWQFDTGEAGDGMQTNPIVIGRSVYTYTASQKVIALDAATGKLLWTFDSGIAGTQPVRGLAYWTDGKESRLLAGIMNFLYALDPLTGRPIESFAEGGRIDLRKGLGGDYLKHSIVLTSPGVIYKDLVIVGGRNPETPPAPPGDLRAFDVHTGMLRWRFRTIPHPGDPGYETWPPDAWKSAGAANNWAGMTLDPNRGIVYVPTGSAVPDFYGGGRVGDDLFADCLLALDANTGKQIWSFQGIHHDIWDRDFPAPPVLLTVKHDGATIDAVAQTTKQGFLFVLDRTTGKPVFPVEERPVLPSTVPGEIASKTQPFPLLPEPFARQSLTEKDLTTRTPEAHAWALEHFRTFISNGQFVPLSVGRQTIVAPGFDGGAEWGGAGVDRTTGVIYLNANNVVATGGLEGNNLSAGLGTHIYQSQCAVCHQANRGGSPPTFPSLIDLEKRLTPAQITNIIHQGKGRMPSSPNLQGDALVALLQYLRTGRDAEMSGDEKEMSHAAPGAGPQTSSMSHDTPGASAATAAAGVSALPSEMSRYNFTGYRVFYDPEHYPAITPPWGTLNAIDLNTGKYLWKIPFGYYPELAAEGMGATGTENYGGPVVTAGGLVFIGATIFDRKFHAFDSRTGALLWESELPFAGLATPTTYLVDGKQYVVIAAGGGRTPKAPKGGVYVAFALP